MMKFSFAAVLAMPSTQDETTNQRPSATLIHSSHSWNTDSVTASTRITRNPTITALRVAVGSNSKRSVHGDSTSQMPSAQSHQSSHCFGGVNETAAMVAPQGARSAKVGTGFASDRARNASLRDQQKWVPVLRPIARETQASARSAKVGTGFASDRARNASLCE